METGVRLVLSCLLVRLRGPLASLRRAHRNASMKKTAAPQTLVNAINPITSRSVPWLQSHEIRSSSIRTQVRPKCDPTRSNLHIQVRDTCDLCEIVRALFSHEKNKGFLDRVARKRDTDVWDRPRARAWFERHNSSTAAENHQGQREAPFVPCLKAAGKRSNTLKSTAA